MYRAVYAREGTRFQYSVPRDGLAEMADGPGGVAGAACPQSENARRAGDAAEAGHGEGGVGLRAEVYFSLLHPQGHSGNDRLSHRDSPAVP